MNLLTLCSLLWFSARACQAPRTLTPSCSSPSSRPPSQSSGPSWTVDTTSGPLLPWAMQTSGGWKTFKRVKKYIVNYVMDNWTLDTFFVIVCWVTYVLGWYWVSGSLIFLCWDSDWRSRNLLTPINYFRFSQGLQDGDSLHDRGQRGGKNPPGNSGYVQLGQLGFWGAMNSLDTLCALKIVHWYFDQDYKAAKMFAHQDAEGKFINYKIGKGSNSKLLAMLREKHGSVLNMPPPGTEIKNFKF